MNKLTLLFQVAGSLYNNWYLTMEIKSTVMLNIQETIILPFFSYSTIKLLNSTMHIDLSQYISPSFIGIQTKGNSLMMKDNILFFSNNICIHFAYLMLIKKSYQVGRSPHSSSLQVISGNANERKLPSIKITKTKIIQKLCQPCAQID